MPRRLQPPDSVSNIRRKKNTHKEKKKNRKELLEHVITHGIDPEIVNLVRSSSPSTSPSVFDRLQPVASSSQSRIVIEVTSPPEEAISSPVAQPSTSGTAVQHRQVIELSPADDVTSPVAHNSSPLQQSISVFDRLGSSCVAQLTEEAHTDAAAEDPTEDVLSVTYETPEQEPEEEQHPAPTLRSIVSVPATSTVRHNRDRYSSYIRNPYIRS